MLKCCLGEYVYRYNGWKNVLRFLDISRVKAFSASCECGYLTTIYNSINGCNLTFHSIPPVRFRIQLCIFNDRITSLHKISSYVTWGGGGRVKSP